MNINSPYLQKILFELIAIPSENPSLVPGASGEAQIVTYLARQLEELNLAVEIFEPQTGRPSVLGRYPGSGGGRSLMWNAHCDTVGAGDMLNPFSPRLEAGRVSGRGAQDMKGSLAAMLAAVEALRRDGHRLRGDLLIAGVADEEYGSLGTADLIDRLKNENRLPDGAIVTEPTELQIAAAHRGYVWMEVKTHGRAAHGSRWWEGRDANQMIGRVLVGLEKLNDELVHRSPHPLVGPPSLHTPLVSGGREMSIYADGCKLQIERRTVPGETPLKVAAEIQSLLDDLRANDPDFIAELSIWFDRPFFEGRSTSVLLPLLAKAAARVLGADNGTGGVPFWTDAALLAGAGVDSLLIGPRGAGLHTADEWVDLASCIQLAEILAETALEYCG